MNSQNLARCFLLLWISLIASPMRAAVPEWIWHDNKGAKPADNEVRYFRKTFKVDARVVKAVLSAAGDDEIQVYLNGHKVIDAKGWDKATQKDVTKEFEPGENLIAIRGKNITADAGVIVRLKIELPKKREQYVLTDTSWLSSATETPHWSDPEFKFDSSTWTRVLSLGEVGVQPWGDVMAIPSATPAKELTTLPGFKVELLRSSQPGEGSWVCMTVDQKGRLIVSPQQGTKNLLRITLSRDGQIKKIETINQPVGGAMGLLYAFDSLYVNGQGPKGLGLYRLHDNRLFGPL